MNEKSLTDYPRPSVAVDVAVLTVDERGLAVVVVDGPRGLALPGTFLHPGERLSDAAERALSTKADLTGTDFHQLAMFDAPDRDDRGWVLSMAHGAALPVDRLPPDVRLVRIDDRSPGEPLAFDHAEMVSHAVDDLRARYSRHVDPSGLLPEEFTVLELRRLYEAIYDRTLPKDTFRRLVVEALETTGRTSSGGAGRPAEIFRRTGAELPAGATALLAG
ncbi:hypothetical protein Br6_04676 [Rhodococcus sp. Br-6]|uniref:NUDIX hydrolase n=1 Tax=Rhodococcus hoagii TaxID=43767 RepID=UPI0008538897|nr:NUDIX hydrolase [Prescottella equi]NKS87352.1 NUDIX hydrolase [Prescottella equi]ORJ93169.1 hydrolase [Prescottella equi]GBF17270.1 hypothetical protein Br6_04676 [Rhodococcus sp. Br-6]